MTAIRDLIETERKRFEVAGCAVAIVQNGKVILAEGFGLANLEKQTKVTADTYFPIASDTKCFTAAAVAQLADEGKLDLDAPIRNVIPWFEMSDPHATALVSARDLLSHRTGLPRHDLMWYGETNLTYEAVARSLKHLEMSRQLRQTWQYNNLAYVTAGYLTEVLTGQKWEDALTERLLVPAGMKNTVFGVGSLDPADIATPYNRIKGVPVAQALPRPGTAGPAGAIVSTVNDMSNWLLARLGEKPEVLSKATLTQLHAPTMIGAAANGIFPERQALGYALGCQNESYRGIRMVNHGGNLVGFSSMVAVVPEHNLGIVVLTNDHGTPLRDVLPVAIIDRLLDLSPIDWGQRLRELQVASLAGAEAAKEHHKTSATGTPPTRPLEGFAGTYLHPAYGPFGISVSGTSLVPDFHGMAETHSLRHRSVDAWDLLLHDFDDASCPLVFAQGVDGEITGFSIALEGLVAPIPFVKQPDALDPALAEALPGAYAMGPIKLTIRTRGAELVADVQGQGTLTLVHRGGARFGAAEIPAVVLDVVFTPADGVTQLILDPVGIFTPVT